MGKKAPKVTPKKTKPAKAPKKPIKGGLGEKIRKNKNKVHKKPKNLPKKADTGKGKKGKSGKGKKVVAKKGKSGKGKKGKSGKGKKPAAKKGKSGKGKKVVKKVKVTKKKSEKGKKGKGGKGKKGLIKIVLKKQKVVGGKGTVKPVKGKTNNSWPPFLKRLIKRNGHSKAPQKSKRFQETANGWVYDVFLVYVTKKRSKKL